MVSCFALLLSSMIGSCNILHSAFVALILFSVVETALASVPGSIATAMIFVLTTSPVIVTVLVMATDLAINEVPHAEGRACAAAACTATLWVTIGVEMVQQAELLEVGLEEPLSAAQV